LRYKKVCLMGWQELFIVAYSKNTVKELCIHFDCKSIMITHRKCMICECVMNWLFRSVARWSLSVFPVDADGQHMYFRLTIPDCSRQSIGTLLGQLRIVADNQSKLLGHICQQKEFQNKDCGGYFWLLFGTTEMAEWCSDCAEHMYS
jgi:hypothetical protein